MPWGMAKKGKEKKKKVVGKEENRTLRGKSTPGDEQILVKKKEGLIFKVTACTVLCFHCFK